MFLNGGAYEDEFLLTIAMITANITIIAPIVLERINQSQIYSQKCVQVKKKLYLS